MVLEIVGSLLPFAAGIALSPFPIIAVVLLLAPQNGRANGAAFLGGWLLGLGVLTTVSVLLIEGVDDSADGRAVVDWLRILVGLVLFAAAWKKWRSRPVGGVEPELPGWMASLDRASVAGAGRIGALLGGVNPKNIAFAAAAGATIALLSDDGADEAIAAVIFVLLSSATVLAAVAVRFFAGQRATTILAGTRQFMVQNANVITMVVFALLGAKVIGEGLSGLSA